MDAGAYRNLVTIQEYVRGYDEIGNPVREWKQCRKDHAYINGLSGREYWEAAAVQQEETVEFIFRWKPYFDQMDKRTHRLVFRGKIFDIQHIDNVRYRNQTVKIKAVTNNGTEDKK